jgi:hypothetical protein
MCALPAVGRSGAERNQHRLAGRDQRRLSLCALREQLRPREHLLASGAHDVTLGDEACAGSRPDAVHREVRCGDAADDGRGSKAAGGVEQGCDHSGMQMAGILGEVVAPRHA